MNIEQLNKSQIVLLTLLVSFVTSIATGIVTVSLMDQAPPVVAQTVNRIVERTIETVAPASQTAAGSGSQNVVKESELIAQAVAKITPSIVRLYSSTTPDSPFLGLGIVVKETGVIVTDVSIFTETDTGAGVALSDGTRVAVTIASRNAAAGTALLQSSSEGETVTWEPAVVKANTPTLGQTIVMLSGRSVARVEEGIVSAIIPIEGTSHFVVDTNISPETIVPGAPLFNIEGDIVGVSTGVSRTSSAKGFTASPSFAEQPKQESSGESGNSQ